MEQFVATYGYAAIVLGTFLEGETILVIGGFLAHRGYLALPGVVAAAFAGTFAGDQLFYLLGRRGGMAALQRRPRWQARAARVFQRLREHELAVILGFRFVYGLRTVTPFLIGASRVPAARFLPLNAAGAALWALGVGSLGYLLGEALQTLLGDLERLEAAILAAIAAAGVVLSLASRRRRERGPRQDAPSR